MERLDDLQFENLKLIQNTEWFRFGIDSVLLTEFAKDIKKNKNIVDLGAGTGILGILLSKKVAPKKIIEVEVQEDVCKLANKNVKINHLEEKIEVMNTDILNLNIQKNYYDVVVTNPPYKKSETGINPVNRHQEISRFETTATLDDWIRIASSILNSKGDFYMVYRTDRLVEVFQTLEKYKLEPKRIRFVYSNASKESKLVMIKAIKNGGKYLTVEKPLIIYDEDGSYTNEVLEIYKNDKK